jgi:glutamine cyclotransferase
MYRELPNRYFCEGIVIIGDRLYQLTWKSREGFIYDKTSLKLIDNFYYDHEGWGATTDGVAIIISDGSPYLYFYNPDTFELQKKLLVKYLERKSGEMTPLRHLNDLQYINGKIWANIWKTNRVAVINPSSGFVERFVDFKNLLDTKDEWIKQFKRKKDRCLNGIAYDQAEQRLFVTGKMWTKVYEIMVIDGKVDLKIDAKSPKKCPEGKILNPKTGRCIKNKNLIDKKPPIKSPKKCPEGKILNPKTGRCILIKKKLLKEK